jgi:hypothetical protein
MIKKHIVDFDLKETFKNSTLFEFDGVAKAYDLFQAWLAASQAAHDFVHAPANAKLLSDAEWVADRWYELDGIDMKSGLELAAINDSDVAVLHDEWVLALKIAANCMRKSAKPADRTLQRFCSTVAADWQRLTGEAVLELDPQSPGEGHSTSYIDHPLLRALRREAVDLSYQAAKVLVEFMQQSSK